MFDSFCKEISLKVFDIIVFGYQIYQRPMGETLPPSRGDLKPTFSESLMSPIYEIARLAKNPGWIGGVTPP